MLKANEVRPGNTILSHLTKKPVTVDYLVIKHLEDGNIQSVHNPEIPVYEPILLTKEWLIKLGIVKKVMPNWFDWRGIEVPNVECESMVAMDSSEGLTVELFEKGTQKASIGKPCKYVHEVQNLYFTLAGNELIIK